MSAAGEIGERLRTLTGGAAVALKLDPHEYADQYFAALSATLRDLGSEPGTRTIYVSVTNPAALVSSLAQALDVPQDRLFFVDAISHIMMDFRDPIPQAVYLESPRMLEVLMLRVEYLLRKFPAERSVVIIDSVNSLAIHNPPDLLTEFFHILLNNLKTKQVLTVLLTTAGESNAIIDQMLSLAVDETIEVSVGRS